MVVAQFSKASAYNQLSDRYGKDRINFVFFAPLNSFDVKDKINSLRSPHLRTICEVAAN